MASRLLRCSNISKSRAVPFSSRHYWHNPTEGREPCHPIIGKQPVQCETALDAIKQANIKSNQRVFVHGAACTPEPLLYAMCQHAKEENLSNIGLVHIHLMGDAPFVKDEYKRHFRDNSLFMGANVRKAVNAGDADFTPMSV